MEERERDRPEEPPRGGARRDGVEDRDRDEDGQRGDDQARRARRRERAGQRKHDRSGDEGERDRSARERRGGGLDRGRERELAGAAHDDARGPRERRRGTAPARDGEARKQSAERPHPSADAGGEDEAHRRSSEGEAGVSAERTDADRGERARLAAPSDRARQRRDRERGQHRRERGESREAVSRAGRGLVGRGEHRGGSGEEQRREQRRAPEEEAIPRVHRRRGDATTPRSAAAARFVVRPRSMAFPAPELLVLRGARAIDGAALDAVVDAVVERGVLTRLGKDAAREIPPGAGEQIDARGSWLFPGLVDIHAHLREPGFEYKEDIASGLAAAAAGGFVHVCAMANTKPVNDSRAITELIVARGRELGGVRLSPIGAITQGQRGETLAEMADMRAAGAVGVSDDGRCVMSAAVMRRALEYARTHDLVTIQHAEDHTLTDGAQMHEGAVSTRLGLRGWPRVAEDVIVARDLLLAELTGARYHVAHLSSHVAARLVAEGKSRGLAVTAEVTPHHLLLTDAALLGYDPVCKVNPPLREQVDVDALWAALRDGTIDCVATDHAPHSPIEKDVELANAAPGMIGLELCLPLLVEQAVAGKVPLARLIDALTRAPAKVVGIDAPALREGAPADLCLFDPDATFTVGRDTLRSKSLNTPFLGRTIRGAIRLTVARGRIVHRREAAR